MRIEVISKKQGIMLMTLFIMGSTLIIGAGAEAKRDIWLAIILALALAIPVSLIYSRILSLFPGKDAYEILETVLGKAFGKLLSLLFIWYSFHLGALIFTNFGEFVSTVAFPETPKIVPSIILGFLCILAIKDGIEMLARWCELFLPAIILVIFIVQLLLIPNLNFKNVLPFFAEGYLPLLKGTFSAFSFPFCESVIFIFFFHSLKDNKSFYGVYLSGLLIGGFIVLLISVRNVLVLGNASELYFFPSYAAVSKVNIANFIQRIEGSVSLVFIVSGFVKICVCLLATCNGIAKTIGLKNYRAIATPVGLLMLGLSYFIYDNVMEMKDWAFEIYPYYAFPFQVILPIIIWIAAEMKAKKSKANKKKLPKA